MATIDRMQLEIAMEVLGTNTILKDMKRIELGAERVRKKYSELGITTNSQMSSLGKMAELSRQESASLKNRVANIRASAVAVKQLATAQEAYNKREAAFAKGNMYKVSGGENAMVRNGGGGGFQNLGIRDLDKEAKNAAAATKKLNKSIQDAKKSLKEFKMEYLSVMFFGMAIQRAFMGILRAGYQTWSTVTDGTSKAGGAMTQLQAAWEFFKFSLFDALIGSGIFAWFVENVLKLVEWWGDLSDSAKELTAETLLTGAAIGTIMAVGGTIMLGLGGLGTVLVEAEIAKTKLAAILGVFTIGLAISNAAETFSDVREGKWVEGLMSAMATAFQAVAAMKFIKGKGGGWLLVIGVALDAADSSVFWDAMFGIMSALSALWVTLFEEIGENFSQIVGNKIADYLEYMANLLKNLPFMSGVAKLMTGLATTIRTRSAAVETPFSDRFRDNLSEAQQMYGDIRQIVQDAVSWTNGNIQAVVNVGAGTGSSAVPNGGVQRVIVDNWDQIKDDKSFAYYVQRYGGSDLSRSGMGNYSAEI